MSFIVPVKVDYGALEVLWYSSFKNIESIILWWKVQEDIDIYKYNTALEAAKNILGNEKLVGIKTEEESNLFYKLYVDSVSLMIDNNYTSYLSYGGKKYFHKGKLNFSSAPPPM
ncbi:hypothetical protein [Acinetobacter ursingii]|uniref:hypothetical protein n=1 Tax=Acinetobacter ursingii TaxID=108980 RepID=UPI00124F4F90|nr:hypothetical protein [Acinetobacter ursingii]